jgi:hypothetical protein
VHDDAPENGTIQLDVDFELPELPLNRHVDLVEFNAQLEDINFADQTVSK